MGRSPRLLTALVAAAGLVGCAGDRDGTRSPQEPPGTDRLALVAALSVDDPHRHQLNVRLAGDTPCEEREYVQPDLHEPARILPVDGVMTTELYVELKARCIPVFDTATKTWSYEEQMLRTYGFPKDHADPPSLDDIAGDAEDGVVWSAPGPTFVLYKASAPGVNDGTELTFTLHNSLEPEDDPHRCDEMYKRGNANFGEPFRPETEPNCFHGNNSTNFHFHGSHVSPQEHQDFVGLELLPYGAEAPMHAVHGRGTVAIGEYAYDFDRLRYTQAEGTHWYHAHKHGSTALQVLNGLVGSALIYGEFDRELESLFEGQGGLTERLLVVQQLQDLPPGLGGNPSSPPPLVNGQANPIVRMKPGEIQRWRFVGATMQASAKLEIGFPKVAGHPEIRQIAMDGIQFAPENYRCQPVLHGPDCAEGTEDDLWTDFGKFELNPGNRIDILIKAPAAPGRYTMHFEMRENGLHEDVMEHINVLMAALAEGAGSESPPLLTLEVDDVEPVEASFPTAEDFPKLPSFLDDLVPQNPDNPRVAAYQMQNRGNLYDKPDQPGVYFAINDKQYDPDCVNETLVIDEVEEWKLTNNSSIAHPFHIHTNPFQVVRELRFDEDGEPQLLEYQKPYVWRDTVAIPTAQTTGPKADGEVSIYYAPREFTGEFVNHCHILGHEDRGMMHAVQVTCPNGMWGKPTRDLSPECVEGNYREAAPKCGP
ncbi:MAG: multicopper oxidase domain-containing protein [Acidobacteriota bacterium]